MAKSTRGGSLSFVAKVDTAQAKKDLAELKKMLADLRISSSNGKLNTPTYNVKPLTEYQQRQVQLKEVIIQAQAASEQLRQKNLELSASYKQGQISAQQASAAERQNRNDRKALADATRAARLAQVAATGSYDEANKRLKDLGRSIKAAEGGFRSSSPAIQAQIKEYNQLNQSLKDFDAKMGNHQRNVGNYKTAVEGVVADLRSMATAYLSVQGAIMLASKSFDVNRQFEAIETSLRFTLGSAEAATAKLKELKQTALLLGQDFLPVAESYAKFAGAARAANFPLAETDRIFKAISVAGARFNLTSDQVSGALLAIQQMISKGTVQAEELRGQLSERLPGAFSLAAQAMGVTEQQLGKLLEKGEVLASDLLPKLATQLEKSYGLKAGESIDTLNASVGRLSTTVDTALKSDGFGRLAKGVVNATTNIVSAFDKLMGSRSVKEFFGRFFSFRTGDGADDMIGGNSGNRFDKINAIDDLMKSSLASRKGYNPTGSESKFVVAALADKSLEELEQLRKKYLTAATEAANTVNIYRKGISKGILDDGDAKYTLKQAEANFHVLQNIVAEVNKAYQIVEKRTPKVVAGTKELTDEQLTSITAIRKRISDLSKKDGSAIEGSEINNRIDFLKERLKQLSSSSEIEEKQYQSAIKARNTLQGNIDALVKKGTDKQLSADEQEVEGVKKKYTDMLNAAREYNAAQQKLDVQSKKEGKKVRGLRVNTRGLAVAQDDAVAAVEANQYIEKFKVQVEQQKSIYADYESFRLQASQETADKVYGAQLKGFKSYVDYLKSLEPTVDQLTSPNAKTKAQAVAMKDFVSKETAKADAEALVNQKAYLSQLVEQNQNFDQQRVALIAKSNKDVADLRAKGYEVEADQLERNTNEQLNYLNEAAFKQLDIYKQLFDNINLLTAKQTEAGIKKLYGQAGIALAAGRLNIVQYRGLIQELDRSMLALKNNGTPQTLQGIGAGFSEVANEVGRVNDSLGRMVGALGNALSGFGRIAGISNELMQLAETARNGELSAADRVKQTQDQISLYTAAAQGIANVIGGITSSAKQRKEAEQAYYAAILKQQNDYNLSLNEEIRLRSELNGNLFTKDYKAKIVDGTAALVDANQKYNDSLRKLQDGKAKVGQRDKVDGKTLLGSTASGALAGAAIGSILGGGVLSVPAAAAGAIVGGIVGAIGGIFSKKKKDVFGGLLEEYPELIKANGEFNDSLAQSLIANNLVDDQTKAMLDNTLALADARKKAIEQINSVITDLAGSLGDDLRNSLVQAFRDGTDAAKAFGDSVTKVVENIVSQFLFQEVFGAKFKQLEENMKASYAVGGDQNLTDDLVDFYKEAGPLVKTFNEGLKAAKDAAKQQGLDVFSPDSGSASSNSAAGKLSASLTEDTATRIYGVMAGTQLATVQIKDAIIPMGKTIGDMYQIALQQFNSVILIERNTRKTAENTNVLPDMFTEIKSINKNSGDSLSAMLRAAGK